MKDSSLEKIVMSRRQYVVTAMLVTIAFKMSQFPSVMNEIAGQQGILTLILLMCVELFILFSVYSISERGGLSNCLPKNWLSKVLICLLLLFFTVKLIINITEILTFSLSNLFESIRWVPVLCAVVIVTMSLGRKKAFSIGRVSQVALYVGLAAVIFNILFSSSAPEPSGFFPLYDNQPKRLFSGLVRQLWTIGDSLPLVFIAIKQAPHDTTKVRGGILLVLGTAFVLGFYTLCVAIYGRSLFQVGNIVGRIALFNSISEELGSLDLPLISAWLFASIINLGILFMGAKNAINNISKNHWLYTGFGVIILILIISVFNSYSVVKKMFLYEWTAFLGGVSVVLTILLLIMKHYIDRKRGDECEI